MIPKGASALPVRRRSDGVTVAVRLTPNAKANRIGALIDAGDGMRLLTARVTAVPEAGKANAALIRLLAKDWRLPKSSLSIAAGATDRTKSVRVAGDTDGLYRHIVEWFKERHDRSPTD